MDSVFNYADEIIKDQYPDLILEDEPIEETEEPVDELLPSPELNSGEGEAITVMSEDNSDIVNAINVTNSYWELFLDSYSVEVNHSLSNLYSPNLGWKFSSSGSVSSSTASSDQFSYFPVTSGVTYDLINISFNSSSTAQARYGVVDNISFPTTVTNFGVFSVNDFPDTFSFTAVQDGYFVIYCNPRIASYLATWVTTDSESYTLSELGNAVMQTQKQVSIIETCLLMMILIFLAHTVVKHLFWRVK